MTVQDASDRDAPGSFGERLRDAVPVPVDGSDRPWLALSLLPGVVAVAVYLATNPYPAYGGGLYAQIATEIAANGYAPPASIPGYAAPVPFAYPPLQFYVLAVLLDLGFDPLTVTRVLPGVAVVAGLVPAYLLGRDSTGSRAAGTATATGIALNPQVLEWHVSAGGVVRAFAFLYALTAVYAGYHVFAGDQHQRRAVLAGVVAVALTGLSHPTYALFVVASYLVLWAGFDRSVAGLCRGTAVGLGAVLLASPWLAWVVATHGTDVFTAAAGTHGGIGGGAATFLAGDASPYEVVPLVAAGAVVALRRDATGWTVAAWTVAATLLFSQPRFGYAVGALAAATAGLALVTRLDGPAGATGPTSPRGWLLSPSTPDRRVWVAAGLVLAASVAGGGYLATEMTLTTDPSSPAFVDDESVATAAWAAAETPDHATFVVVGDAAEWFPALSDRAILVGPWGVEWVSARAYDRQLGAFERLSACRSHTCVETAAASVDASPTYVVVPRGQYTVRGETAVQFGTLERSFDLSDDWERVYGNEGTVVYRVVDRDGDATGQTTPRSEVASAATHATRPAAAVRRSARATPNARSASVARSATRWSTRRTGTTATPTALRSSTIPAPSPATASSAARSGSRSRASAPTTTGGPAAITG